MALLYNVCLVFNFLFSSDEPEEEVSFEDLESRAKSGDAKAQTKVSVKEHFTNILTLTTIWWAQNRSAN